MKKRLNGLITVLSMALLLTAIPGCAVSDPAAAAAAAADTQTSVEQEINGWEKVEEESSVSDNSQDAAPEAEAVQESPAEEPAEEAPAEEAPAEEDLSGLDHTPPSKEAVDQSNIVLIDAENGIQDTVRILPVDDPAPEPEEKIEAAPQIVIFGDSQFGNFRTETGMAYLLGQYCRANIYNCAQGGTTAAMEKYDSQDVNDWSSRSFVGMCQIATGAVKPDFVKDYSEAAYHFLSTCDFSKTDYFIVEYGLNDYLSKYELNNMDNLYDPFTYGGALRTGISMLQSAFPEAKIIVCCPSYAQFFSAANGGYLGDGNILSNGIGTLRDYASVCGNVAGEFSTEYINAYDWLNIWSVNAREYLLDGIHLNEQGRHRYALLLSRFILRDLGYEFDQGKVEVYYIDWEELDRELKELNIP